MPSIRGIYYDLNESNFTFKYDDFMFYFSSRSYLEKFKRLYINLIKEETLKLSIKYDVIIYCDEMILLKLYKQIEKRGFKVTYKGKDIEKQYHINMTFDENINLKV